MKLIDILKAKRYNTDKHTVHQYIQEYYENALSKDKNKSISLLEIGVLHGESLKLWHDYFTDIELYGIDIFKRVDKKSVETNLAKYNVRLDIVDSFNDDWQSVEQRSNYSKTCKGFDIIIDDGLHTAESQFKTFYNFQPYMNKGGLYVIEDIRDSSIQHLSTIDNIQFHHLNDRGHPAGKQYIAEIKF